MGGEGMSVAGEGLGAWWVVLEGKDRTPTFTPRRRNVTASASSCVGMVGTTLERSSSQMSVLLSTYY